MHHILHMAVSIRRSPALRSTSADVRNVIASIANVFAAISATFPAMAECCPIGAPHWMRSLDHFRQISTRRFDNPTHAAGIVRRPVFNVVNATFNPWPSFAIRFSRGTRTFVNFTMPL